MTDDRYSLFSFRPRCSGCEQRECDPLCSTQEHPYEAEAELARVITEMREGFAAVVAEFDALAEDALGLCDQHISTEVRKETQHRIIERVQRFDAVRKVACWTP